MKDASRAACAGVCSKLLTIAAVCVLLGCCLVAGKIDGVMAQDGTTAPAAAQPQPGAPASAATPCTTPAKDAPPYLLGRWWSFGVAMLFLLVVLVLTVRVKSDKGINFFQSPDCSVSVSKVQIWMWTMAIIFSYVYLFLWHGPPCDFPSSLWELMGISALSTGAARYISAVTGDKLPTPEAQATIDKQNWVVSMLSDDGQPSMMRLQMFGWTLVSVFLFLMFLHKEQKLWDVPQTLVILMGISHAGYLGDKGAAAAKPD
jgi:hypothetical protein